MMFEKRQGNIKGVSIFSTWQNCVRIIFALFFMVFLSFDGNCLGLQNIAQTNEPEIYFMGYEAIGNGTKFIYRIDSGSVVIRYWEIRGFTFDIEDIRDVSESFVYLEEKLRFIDKYTQDEVRDVWFILNKNFDEFSIVQISVIFVGDNGEISLQIVGPVCLTPNESNVTSYFEKQDIITVGASVLGFYLLYFFNKK